MENLLKIKVQLQGMKPSRYRTFVLSEDDTFYDLHEYIQRAFGFDGYHLWNFGKRSVQGYELEITDMDSEGFEAYAKKTLNAYKTKLSKIFIKDGINKLTYEYDFGDSWEFDVVLQKITEKDKKIESPKLIKTQGGMCIEDCGGIWGLEEYIEIYNDKSKFYENMEDMFDNWDNFCEYIEPATKEIDLKTFEL